MTRPITRTVAAAAASAPLLLNTQSASPFNVNLLADVTGTLTYSVQYTVDDVFEPTYDPTVGVWNTVTGMSAQTADAAGNLAYPVTAVRVLVTSYTSGFVTLTVVQQT